MGVFFLNGAPAAEVWDCPSGAPAGAVAQLVGWLGLVLVRAGWTGLANWMAGLAGMLDLAGLLFYPVAHLGRRLCRMNNF